MKKCAAITVLVFLMGTGLSIAADPLPRVKLITSQGDIVVELDRAAAPKTVDNFLAYVKAGFYDGTIFHRVIAGFMIQGGGFDAEMKRKSPRPPILNEADNGLSNNIGTIAMARTSDPHSAGAQFFINVKDNPFLDHRGKTSQGWGYCVFGKVVQGMNVVRAIENVPTTSRSGMRDVPKMPVVIKQATVVTPH
ncbi:MAG: peptidylprolyl isomerase [Desulfobacteraceae bacterium]|jgi:peptidyl-prolyl cis-trans isomerase B (cyclophilin B)|nr:peptidylprolyl isomerase [Desulfobacteraceae bacterium]